MSRTQKAVILTEVGKPVTLVTDWPVPEPGANQVQLKVSVAGLNPHDHKARDWGLFVDQLGLPLVLAHDVVGRVTKLGEGVAGLAVGDRIVSQPNFTKGSLQTGLQEYTIADDFALSKIPDPVTDDGAATLPTNIIAPLVALFHTLEIPAPWSPAARDFDYAGAALLVVGGGSSCGRFGVQLAKLAGIGTIVVVGGDEAELKSHGATHVVDRHIGDDAILARIRDVVGDDLVYAFDAINPPDRLTLSIDALSSHKKGVLARLLPNAPADVSKVAPKKAGFEVRDLFGSTHAQRELCDPFWERLAGYLESGQIKPLGYTVKEGLTAKNVNEVLDAYRDGKRVKKTHIHV
ncbi:putative alcohol dehydrogenase [Xylariomycetidae sp. FL2044]|nr:putative alcohol dehydrogenase [Xylariomycetidae sp. FL2044]